jgi:serine/threonine protein kinase/ABC-type branched-subunit amino acid transport system substrate-binding protein
MADVYRARHVGAAGFQRTVVIKHVLNVGDPESIRMFINEAKLAAELTHPNVAQIYELGEVNGEFYIAMEYVHGRDLANVLNVLASRKTPTPPVVAAFIAREVCRALAHAHAHNDPNGAPCPIIHRDVSPANIVIGYDGQVKLVDFGVAKALHLSAENPATQAGMIKGKLGYMAPEQMDGFALPQSDLFSTGVVLHEMLTQRRLLRGENSLETMTKVKTMTFQPPSRITANIPSALDAIVLKALERNLDARYPSAAAMAKDLDLFVNAVGFSVEDMGRFMTDVYPAGTRTDLTGLMPAPHRSGTQPSQANRQPQLAIPAHTLGDVSIVISTPRPASTRRRVLFGSAVLVALLAVGGYAAYSLGRRGEATASAAVTPPPAPAGAPALPPPPSPPRQAREPGSAPITVRGVTDTEIVFGMAGPMSGSGKEYGRQMKAGIETAFQVANEAGGIHGRRLRLIAVDDGYEPARTLPAMRQLYDQHKVFGVVGNFGTATAAVALPFALEHKMLFFGAYSGASLLRRDPPDRYVFNFRASYAEEAAAIIRHLIRVRRVRPEHIAVFAQDDAFGEAVYGGIAKTMRELRPDAASLFRIGYQRNSLDVEAAVNQVRARAIPVEVVVLLALARPAAKFIERVRGLSRTTQFITGSWIDSSGLAEELKMLGPRYASGVVVTQVVPSFESSATAVLECKAAMAKHQPGERLDSTSLEAYLMANLLIEGLRRAGREIDTERLVNGFEAIRDFDLGIGAPISLGSGEHQGSHKVWGVRLDETGHYQPVDLE